MTQIGSPVPPGLAEIHLAIQSICKRRDYLLTDARALVTGKDFLLNIWSMLLSVPVGIAVLHEDMGQGTLANIFYELGLMQAYGKETIVVKTPKAAVPSDFVRQEYIVFDDQFDDRLDRFFHYLLDERASYFTMMGHQLERNPLLAIDYHRRAYLLSTDEGCKACIDEIRSNVRFEGRAMNSVEMLATQVLLASS